MSLWGSKDQANNAPKYRADSVTPNTGIQVFGTGVVGLDTGEVASGNAAHAGWNRVIRGTGPVVSFTITNAGTGYANTDTVRVSGGTANAAATIRTNGSGAITQVNLTDGGKGFANVASSNVAITTGAGTGAVLTVVLGGRAGRITTETLVAMGSMTANGSSIPGF